MKVEHDSILSKVSDYYSRKIIEFGPTSQGVDWNSQSCQELRLEKLLMVCNLQEQFTINDIGAGYGHLYKLLSKKDLNFEYYGFDLSTEMVNVANNLYGNNSNFHYQYEQFNEAPQTYSLASGIFNVKMGFSNKKWQAYILDMIHKLNNSSIKGFSFNCLTKHSDAEYQRNDLYYADPGFFLNYCIENFSKQVVILHNYGLYEFTVLVYKG